MTASDGSEERPLSRRDGCGGPLEVAEHIESAEGPEATGPS